MAAETASLYNQEIAIILVVQFSVHCLQSLNKLLWPAVALLPAGTTNRGYSWQYDCVSFN
jgi:hypothetical protein